MDNESVLNLTLMCLAVGFVVGWVMSRQFVAHTLRKKGLLHVNYSLFKCYEVIEEISPCDGIQKIG